MPKITRSYNSNLLWSGFNTTWESCKHQPGVDEWCWKVYPDHDSGRTELLVHGICELWEGISPSDWKRFAFCRSRNTSTVVTTTPVVLLSICLYCHFLSEYQYYCFLFIVRIVLVHLLLYYLLFWLECYSLIFNK